MLVCSGENEWNFLFLSLDFLRAQSRPTRTVLFFRVAGHWHQQPARKVALGHLLLLWFLLFTLQLHIDLTSSSTAGSEPLPVAAAIRFRFGVFLVPLRNLLLSMEFASAEL